MVQHLRNCRIYYYYYFAVDATNICCCWPYFVHFFICQAQSFQHWWGHLQMTVLEGWTFRRWQFCPKVTGKAYSTDWTSGRLKRRRYVKHKKRNSGCTSCQWSEQRIGLIPSLYVKHDCLAISLRCGSALCFTKFFNFCSLWKMCFT